MFSEVFTVICALLGIIGLIFLSAYAVKWLNKHFGAGGFGGSARSVKIIECVSIAQDKQLLIVTVGSKTMLLGVTPNAVNKICDLDESDIAVLPDETSAEGGFMKSFRKVLSEKTRAAEDQNPEVKKDGRNENDDF